jgi:hypothetical protein
MKLNFLVSGKDERSDQQKKCWQLAVRANRFGQNYIYLNKPKCGCSVTKRAFWIAEAKGERISFPEKNVSKVEGSPFTTSVDYVVGMSDDAFVFTFVRNPYVRILSCYRDKVMKDIGNPNVLEPLKAIGVGERSVSFVEFLRYVRGQHDFERNNHWMSMRALHIEDQLSCDFVGSIENYSADIAKIFSVIYPRQVPEVHNINSQKHKKADVFSDEEAELIREIYNEDFEYFGYSTSVDDIYEPPTRG